MKNYNSIQILQKSQMISCQYHLILYLISTKDILKKPWLSWLIVKQIQYKGRAMQKYLWWCIGFFKLNMLNLLPLRESPQLFWDRSILDHNNIHEIEVINVWLASAVIQPMVKQNHNDVQTVKSQLHHLCNSRLNIYLQRNEHWSSLSLF